MEIDFVNYSLPLFDEYEEIYLDLMQKTFLHLKININYLVDVSLINNEEIRKINKAYRNIDKETDVISFAYFDDENEKIQKDIFTPLGSILISTEKATLQSKEYNHSLKREMSFLFVHGLLHLLGYDHQNKEDEIEMFKLQDEILGD